MNDAVPGENEMQIFFPAIWFLKKIGNKGRETFIAKQNCSEVERKSESWCTKYASVHDAADFYSFCKLFYPSILHFWNGWTLM